MILIITNSKDATADYFCQYLTLNDIPFFRFDTDEYINQYQVKFVFENGNTHFELKHLGSNIEMSSKVVNGVWYRRPVNPIINIQDTSDENLKELGIEARFQYETIIRSLTKSLWVSEPEKLRLAEDRMLQLSAAKEVGFHVPDTVITNIPETVDAFVNKYAKVCIKSLHLGALEVEGKLKMFYTSIIENRDRSVIEKSCLFPLILQQYIPKKREYRITVIGEKVIPVEVIANNGEEIVDWRIEDGTRVSYNRVNLKKNLIHKARKIVAKLGVRFASMDVIESNDDNYYFLDLNPNGQWAWLDQTINTGIASNLSKLLSEGKYAGK